MKKPPDRKALAFFEQCLEIHKAALDLGEAVDILLDLMAQGVSLGPARIHTFREQRRMTVQYLTPIYQQLVVELAVLKQEAGVPGAVKIH